MNPSITRDQLRLLEDSSGSIRTSSFSISNGLKCLDGKFWILVHLQSARFQSGEETRCYTSSQHNHNDLHLGNAIPGIYSALHQYSLSDQTFSFLAFIGISIPNFFFALLWLFMSAKTGWFPIGGLISQNFNDLSFFGKIGDYLWHVVGPMVTLGTSGLAGLMRQMRGQLLDQLRQDYVLFARAKGMPEKNVIYKHAVRNAINPIVTIFGYALSGLLGGAVLTETVFGWPGMGRLVIEALNAQDLFLVMATLLLSAVLLVIGNLLADLMLAWVDPRIRFRLG